MNSTPHIQSREPAMSGKTGRPRWAWVLGVVILQSLLVLAAVAPHLSARALGDEYRLRVALLDPIDPFRGAYVALSYPDLPGIQAHQERPRPNTPGPAYVPLEQDGSVWAGGTPSARRPASGPYLRCEDDGWNLSCGIESWFVPQEEARQIEEAVMGGRATALVRIDERGNAAIVDLTLAN